MASNKKSFEFRKNYFKVKNYAEVVMSQLIPRRKLQVKFLNFGKSFFRLPLNKSKDKIFLQYYTVSGLIFDILARPDLKAKKTYFSLYFYYQWHFATRYSVKSIYELILRNFIETFRLELNLCV